MSFKKVLQGEEAVGRWGGGQVVEGQKMTQVVSRVSGRG